MRPLLKYLMGKSVCQVIRGISVARMSVTACGKAVADIASLIRATEYPAVGAST
jgi:hypothetical protein